MNPTLTSVISLGIIFAASVIGAAFVFFFKKNYSSKTQSIIIGLASGIMIATSFFGLLLPSIDYAKDGYSQYNISFLPVVGGFLVGCLIMYLMDILIPHAHHSNEEFSEGHNYKRGISKQTKFFLAVTMHNIPEGMAVGLACAAMFNATGASVSISSSAALALAIGIAIQNVPESAAVSIPMLSYGYSKPKAFAYGILSGAVEPVAGVIVLFASFLAPSMLMPWLLSFAAGAMIYVTIDELLPDMKKEESHFGIWSFVIGFAITMVLEMVL